MSDSDRTVPEPVEEPTILPTPGSSDEQATIAASGLTKPPKHQDQLSIQNYELLEELGRGGMGVVHKARDKKLDRIVALKTIIAGNFASDEDITRFRQEAQAAAKLDHPGIVEIYEVSDASSPHHFFSMKYVEGGSLADLSEAFLSDQKRAVELMIKIANAVHHAHQRGILHRDLKPANVLIDEKDQPRITDFGLAKHLNADSGLTRTGMVMGTPGFMAPEQATGKSDVTTSVDVYSLGAILYWLVTGQPPFLGETQLDVIMKTINEQPASVRSVRNAVDLGLDLICQKALNKLPDDRYVSAEALADDLRAWLAGEPLSVKPPTVLQLTSIWIRKNFRSLSIGITTGAICGALIGCAILAVIAKEYLNSEGFVNQLGEQNESWISRYFGWIRNVPFGAIIILPPLMIMLNVLCGIINVQILKPKAREMLFVVAAISALFAGIVSFTTSLGWSPIIRHGIDNGLQDIQLLSDSIWLESDAEKEMARTALFQRYPGLKDVRQSQRGNLIRYKIKRDQAFGIPQGMWEGIGITLCLSAIPLFLATSFAGMIWQRGHRGFSFFGQSFELGIYSALFMLMFTRTFSFQIGLFPGWLTHGATLTGMILAIWFALSQKPWYFRILGFVLANLAVFGSFAMSSRIVESGNMARRAESNADYQTAARYLEMLAEQRDNSYARFRLAIIYAYLNDDANYIRVCKEMTTGFEYMYIPEVAERTAKVNLLKPELNLELGQVHELAQSVSVFSESSKHRHWIMFVRALSELRKANFDAALDWNKRCRDATSATPADQNNATLEATSLIVDAMAWSAKGENEKAAQAYETGTNLAPKFSGENPIWENTLIFEVLKAEAKQALKANIE